MQVGIVQAGNAGVPFGVDDLRVAAGKAHDVCFATYGEELAVFDGHGGSQRVRAVDGVKLTVGKNQGCGRHSVLSVKLSVAALSHRVNARLKMLAPMRKKIRNDSSY